jgi:hypothetical protein
MDLGVVAALTHDGIGITDLALTVEQAGLESLFLFEHAPSGGPARPSWMIRFNGKSRTCSISSRRWARRPPLRHA